MNRNATPKTGPVIVLLGALLKLTAAAVFFQDNEQVMGLITLGSAGTLFILWLVLW